MRRVSFLYNPDNASDVVNLTQFESDCAKLGFKSLRVPVRKTEEVAAAFDILKRDKVQGLIVTGGGTTSIATRDRVILQGAKHRLPAIYIQSSSAESGGLISYGTNIPDLYRRAAAYADKIFKGAEAGDLPIEQPTKFEMVINMKVAKTVGVTIPQSVLIMADKVIE